MPVSTGASSPLVMVTFAGPSGAAAVTFKTAVALVAEFTVSETTFDPGSEVRRGSPLREVGVFAGDGDRKVLLPLGA
jgi:hypothetical protein